MHPRPFAPRPAWIVLALAAPFAISCAYILPASARDFHADPDDAAPAIARALDRLSIQVASLDPSHRRIVTTWVQISSGVSRSRERYVLRWERDPREDTLTISVRHEAQDQDLTDEGVPRWGAEYHERTKEDALLDLVERELTGTAEP